MLGSVAGSEENGLDGGHLGLPARHHIQNAGSLEEALLHRGAPRKGSRCIPTYA